MSNKIWLFQISTIIILPLISKAQNLDELGLLQRCYSQLTSQQIATTDPLYLQVKAGTLSAVSACENVLDSGKLVGTTTKSLVSPTDLRSQNVLATFQRLHYSWFYSKDFPVISWPGHADDIRDLYDSSSPALYYTRALFSDGISASDPVTTTDFLIPQRANMNPAVGPESSHPVTDFIFSTAFSFAPKGVLTGVQSVGSKFLSFPTNPIEKPYRPAGSVDIYSSKGAGFLGSSPYLILNMGTISSMGTYKTDGTNLLHRRWGKAVFHDTLCRDLPVVRESDATAFVQPASPIAFRTTAACVKCHVSHDRVSNVMRNLSVLYVGTGDPSKIGEFKRGGNFVNFHAVTQSSEIEWPYTPDSNFYQRPPKGNLYFRNYKGDLVDESVNDVADLGLKISQTDDYYVCLARRYYKYFLGIDVNTGDLNDPSAPITLGSNAKVHRDNVIKLGLNLKTSQNISQLVKDILKLNVYRKTDFGATGAISGP